MSPPSFQFTARRREVNCKDRCFSEGDGTEHTAAVAFGRLFLVFGCTTSAHFAIVADAHTGHLVDSAYDAAKFPNLDARGATLRSVASDATESILDASGEHHSRPEVVFRRQAPGASCCIDPECELSGGFAHIGPCEPCEPCSCPMLHASWECPLRTGCYEQSYRMFYGASGTKMHVVRSQIERVERVFGKVLDGAP